MATGNALAALEFSSVGIGYQAQDEMLKTASVDLLIARTICSGKYLVVVGGEVGSVESALQTGLQVGDDCVIDQLLLANVHEAVFPALGQSIMLDADHIGSLGLIETFSGVSALTAADIAAKTARVTLFRVHVAMAMGGKGLVMMTGSVSDVQASVQAAAAEVRKRGLLVSEIVIPRPSVELFGEYL
jgi:microcompartment protein CcmL/EutN